MAIFCGDGASSSMVSWRFVFSEKKRENKRLYFLGCKLYELWRSIIDEEEEVKCQVNSSNAVLRILLVYSFFYASCGDRYFLYTNPSLLFSYPQLIGWRWGGESGWSLTNPASEKVPPKAFSNYQLNQRINPLINLSHSNWIIWGEDCRDILWSSSHKKREKVSTRGEEDMMNFPARRNTYEIRGRPTFLNFLLLLLTLFPFILCSLFCCFPYPLFVPLWSACCSGRREGDEEDEAILKCQSVQRGWGW